MCISVTQMDMSGRLGVGASGHITESSDIVQPNHGSVRPVHAAEGGYLVQFAHAAKP